MNLDRTMVLGLRPIDLLKSIIYFSSVSLAMPSKIDGIAITTPNANSSQLLFFKIF